MLSKPHSHNLIVQLILLTILFPEYLLIPRDWHIASEEYTNMLFGPSDTTNSLSTDSPYSSYPSYDTTKPIVVVLPESLDGASLILLAEVLPFPLSIDKYMEITKGHLTTIPISDTVPVYS